MLIGTRGPLHALLALGTGCLLLLPINAKGRQLIPCPGFGLPLVVLTDGSNHLNAMLLTALQDDACISLSRIQQMLAWAEIAFTQGLMDRFGLLPIGSGGIGGHDRCDEVRQVRITGFAEMDPCRPNQARSRLCP